MSTEKLKSTHTWAEFRELITKWMKYGDDPFEDAYSEILDRMEKESDPEKKALFKEVLLTMDALLKYGPRLR